MGAHDRYREQDIVVEGRGRGELWGSEDGRPWRPLRPAAGSDARRCPPFSTCAIHNKVETHSSHSERPIKRSYRQ
eukprot:6208887-Pleurochrysis_carterae.AAC.9